MTPKKWKMNVAHWLHKKYPTNFCWASLVSWAYSPRSIFSLFKEFDFKKGSSGCKSDSISNNQCACYCGQWFEGIHCTDKKFKTPVFEDTELFDQIPF